MACLGKLSVSGVRSFDPESREVIKFFPLTLILGSNGAGKTTLIECLRYAATNEFPPFTNKGKTWIHDLHFAKGHTNRGQVKLAFKDIHEVECVITRSLELTAKRDRSGKVVPQMRTLDAIIKRGEETIVSTKCVQIDSVMLDLLGVSKAVLSDVIFCHQEDSNWPLSESKVLKEKFDQLFGSIGYVKALKRIKDERTEYSKRLTQCEGESKLFQEHKHQADKYSNELHKNQATLASYKEKMNSLNQEIGPIKQELESLAVKEKAMVGVEKTISSLQAQLDEQKKSIDYLKKNIREIFTGTKEELKDKISNFSAGIKTKDFELKKAEKKLEDFEDVLKQLNTKINRISMSKGKLEARHAKFTQDKKKLKNYLQKLLKEESSEFDSLSTLDIEVNTDNALATIHTSLDSRKGKLEDEIRVTLKEFDNSIKEIDRRMDELKSQKSKLEQSIKINNDSIKEKTDEAGRIEIQLKEISQSSSQLKKLAAQLETKKDELRELNEKYDLVNIQKDIRSIYAEQQKLKDKLDVLYKEKDLLIAQNEARAVLQVHLKTQEKEQDNLATIYSEHVNLLQDLGIDENDTDKSFVDELKNKIRGVERKLKNKEASKESLVSDRRKLETQLEMIKMKFENCKKEIKEKESKIKATCGSDSFENYLMSIESELKALRSKSATSSGAETILSEYSVIIEKEAKCPICETDLKATLSKVKSSLTKKIRQLPQEAKKVNEDLAKMEKLYEKLLRLKNDNETVRSSKEQLPKLKQEVLDTQKKVDDILNKIQVGERELKKEKAELDRLRAAEPQAISYDNSIRSLQEVESRIQKCKEELGAADDDLRSLDDVREEIEELSEELHRTEEKHKTLQDEKDLASKQINELKEEIFNLEGKKLNLEKGQQRQVSLTEKCSELQKQVNSLKKDLSKYHNEIKSIEPNLKEVIEERRKLADEKDGKRKQLESTLAKLNRYQDDFAAIGEDISSYLMDDTDSELRDLQEELDQIKKDSIKVHNDKTDLSKKCQEYRKEINEAELGERNLKDNLELQERLEKVTEYEDKLEIEKGKRGAADSVALLKKRQQLDKQYQEKFQLLQQIKGKQEPIVSHIQDLERELSADKYRKAKDNYQSKLVETVELEAICEDLNKLYRALDHSVMVFHKKKMDEINRYLYKLWRQAYRGNDIDYIKIESDTETERSASDKRRSFNYRVVMVRNRVEMDMRGRCSAGQKVIASLVIRLALAEIFSVNCGILALDEPTTNLDKENIQAFADSVSNIVKLHRNHRFQLVIITHDDQFLKCLRESECEYYYEVYKDDKGYSRIKQLSIRERDN
ncbi:DNA repair protein RAD50-like [Tetranychus urticae]|nr:DNA repair protein RAD50-like [Tetranychus urticae]